MKIGIGIVVVLLVALAVQADDSNQDAIGVMAEGYSRNRESFPVINCRFTFVRGQADSLEDALSGNLGEERITQTGHWLVDGSSVRYELLCDPAMNEETFRRMEAHTPADGPSIAVPCSDLFYLRSNEYSLRYSPMNLSANLFGVGDADAGGIRVTPFNIDVMGADEYSNPARYLRDCLDGRFQGHFEGSERIGEADVLVVSIEERAGPDGTMVGHKYALDPNRGYLPVRISDTSPRSGKRFYSVHLLQAQEFSGDRWFPTDVVKVISPDTDPPFDVDRIQVEQLDVDRNVNADEFTLPLASETQVNVLRRMEWTYVTDSEAVHIDDLPALHERCVANGAAYVAKQERHSQPDGTSPASSRSRSIMLLVVNGFGIVALAVFLFVRRRRRTIASE